MGNPDTARIEENATAASGETEPHVAPGAHGSTRRPHSTAAQASGTAGGHRPKDFGMIQAYQLANDLLHASRTARQRDRLRRTTHTTRTLIAYYPHTTRTTRALPVHYPHYPRTSRTSRTLATH